MKRINYKLATGLFLLLFIFSACNTKQQQRCEEERFLFGTYIKIIVYDENKEKAITGIKEAFKEIERIDKKYNSKSEGSLIYNLNSQSNKIKEEIIDLEGVAIFKKVKEVATLSGGKYDITIGPLLKIWGFYDENTRPKIPTKIQIEEAQKKIGFDKFEIENNKIKLNFPVEELDTGSFLKGYAIEMGKNKMLEIGIKHGFISAVSSIATIGTKGDGTPWKIGIQNPENSNEMLGIVELKDESMGVSGDYQTFVEIDGEKYHHIIDKETGYPVKDKKMVVAIGNSSMEEDLLSTAFFLMPESSIKEFIKKQKGIKFLIVRKDSTIYKSDDFIYKPTK